MTAFSLPQNESPGCNPGLISLLQKTSLTGASFLSPWSIQMRTDQSQDRSKSGHKQVTPEEMRSRCAFRLQRMATPETADDGKRKAQFNKLAKLTGLGVRRVEKLFRGYVVKPLGHECETIEAAYIQWLEASKARALSSFQQIEKEHHELAAVAARYASERWTRAVATGATARAVGAPASSTADND